MSCPEYLAAFACQVVPAGTRPIRLRTLAAILKVMAQGRTLTGHQGNAATRSATRKSGTTFAQEQRFPPVSDPASSQRGASLITTFSLAMGRQKPSLQTWYLMTAVNSRGS